MKSNRTLLVIAASLFAAGSLAGCGGKKPTPKPDPTPTVTPEPSPTVTPEPSPTVTPTVTPTPSELPLANGYRDFSGVRGDERAELLGTLEKYAVDTHLTGLTFMGNGGYVMYDSGIVKGTNSYIPGYGFGILGEGRITEPLHGDGVAEQYKWYYHSYETSDPKKLNYMNDKGSVVGDLMGYTAASYWDTQMNETKDGYDWVADLAKVNRPIAVDADGNSVDPADLDGTETFDTFRFPVKVGSELKYSTNTSVARLAAFNNREVELEDYITPYKIYYTAAYGLARTKDNLTGAGSIKGADAYVNASAGGFNADAWENIGIKAKVEKGESFLEFTFNQACTPFYAMYYLASGMFQPVPESFILACGGAGNTDIAVGVANWGVSSTDGKENPGDHWLSTGAYTVEAWNIDQNIVFKKNPNYADRGRYKIAGVHLNIMPNAATDTEAVFREFLANNLSAAGIPLTQLANFKNDPRTTKTSSTSNFKLNLNTCDEETWEELFGVDGTIAQTPKSSYWNLKPAMTNDNFINGLSFAIDRESFCDTIGRTPAFEFFSDNYLIDPENGISYNSTQAHKDAVAASVEGTDGFGFSIEKARASFRAAAAELVADGAYEIGDTIEIEICWMYNSDIDDYGGPIAGYLENAFNSANTGLTLHVNNVAVAEWTDVYYKKMMVGQFDLAFGSISGNPYDPLNFFEVLKSDNSSGFTLNWGIDTNAVDGSIDWDGEIFSFDALWQSADHGAVVGDGALVTLLSPVDIDVQRDADGGLTVYVWVDEVFVDEENFGSFYGICIYAFTQSDYFDYAEFYVFSNRWEEDGEAFFDEEKGCYVCHFSAELISAWLKDFPPEAIVGQGFDLYGVYAMDGKLSTGFVSTIWEGYIPERP